MAKTNPIGVRFDEDMLEVLKKEHGIDSPQKALNFLFNYWRMNKHKVYPMAGVLRKKPEEPKIKTEHQALEIPDNYTSLSRAEKMKLLNKNK
jgi:hypothetical protein